MQELVSVTVKFLKNGDSQKDLVTMLTQITSQQIQVSPTVPESEIIRLK
jgi:hypothetical protein